MRILVTNDDGVQSYTLKLLANVAKKYGDVICIAPSVEQSGKSHSIIIKEPFIMNEHADIAPNVKTYSLSSTPADCVRIAHYYLKEDFDLVLSGVNNGYNLGEDILYSGTIGAASEGILCGKKAIAFSTGRNDFENLEQELEKVFQLIIDEKLLDIHNFWNINICNNPKGIKYTKQGCTYFDAYYENLGEDLLMSRGGPNLYKEKENIGYDTWAIHHNYISITPLTVDRTDYNIIKKINK